MSFRRLQGPNARDCELLELREELIDKESILALQEQRRLLEEARRISHQKDQELETMRLSIAQDTARLEALEVALSRTSARKVVLEKELQEREAEAQRHAETAQEARNACVALSARAQEQEARIAALQLELQHAVRDRDSLQTQLQTQKRVCAELEQQQASLTKSVATNDARFDEARRELAAVRESLATVTREAEILAKSNAVNERLAVNGLTVVRASAKKMVQFDRALVALRSQRDFATRYLEAALDRSIGIRRVLQGGGRGDRARNKLRVIVRVAYFVARLMDAKKASNSEYKRLQTDNAMVDTRMNSLGHADVEELDAIINRDDYDQMQRHDVLTVLALRAGVSLGGSYAKANLVADRPPFTRSRPQTRWADSLAPADPTIAQLKEMRHDLHILSETCKKLEENAADTRRALQQKEAACAQLESALTLAKTDKQLLETDVKGLTAKLAATQDDLAEERLNLETKVRELDHTLELLRQSENSLAIRVSEASSLKSKIGILTESLAERDARVLALERDLQRLQGNVRFREAELESARRVVDQLAAETQNTRREAEDRLQLLRDTELALERERTERAERAKRRTLLLEHDALACPQPVSNENRSSYSLLHTKGDSGPYNSEPTRNAWGQNGGGERMDAEQMRRLLSNVAPREPSL
ncbi:hypothetical protein GMRT_11479 [Giardia muris]|uniref:Coiled-coil protein n=1 Tax=Giardia muris TaxID=5742 RepID=A0A4Z1T6U2_GIAMU|nr:hypothetical protein GMRT_11479 [Giardia muris]|eukprot:TNJ29783.1 hypothetical protein GMRT_11479 [Giardia muris]